jgi:hypothetical protein
MSVNTCNNQQQGKTHGIGVNVCLCGLIAAFLYIAEFGFEVMFIQLLREVLSKLTDDTFPWLRISCANESSNPESARLIEYQTYRILKTKGV